MEPIGIEPTTYWLQTSRSPSWATAPLIVACSAYRNLSRIQPNKHANKATANTTKPRYRILNAASIDSTISARPLGPTPFSEVTRQKAAQLQWAQMDLNHRPHRYQRCALPAEL